MKRLLPLFLAALGAAACDRDPSGPEENLKVGDMLTLNVNATDVCENPVNKRAQVVAVSEHTAVLADLENPANGFTNAEYQAFADEFERVAWPVDTENFGTPSDIDNNGRVLILFTRAVNALTPPNEDFIVGGFFFSRDLFPVRDNDVAQGCPSSNARELFYLLAPDPSGTVNNNPRSKNYVRTSTFGTLAHEFEHLINASRRLYVNDAEDFEETWLDEGLAHIAEELSFFYASGLGPRQNISFTSSFFPSQARVDALNQYQVPNFGRLSEYYSEPEAQSPIQNDDDLATRGSSWQFLRYAADQKGGNERQIWYSLVNSRTKGIANLTAVLGSDPVPILQNWGVANYTDDSGVANVPGAFTHPSWNYRQVLSNEALGGFRLRTYNLGSVAPTTLSVAAGSQAYLRFRVLPGARADVRTSTPGTTVAGACTPVSLSVGQVYQGTAAAAAALCVDGGAEGGEYTMIPFYGSTSGSARTQLTVTATGVATVQGPPSPSLSPSGPTLSRAASRERADGGWESRLRQREREVLRPLFARGPARSVSADPAAPEVRISLVRTK